MSENRELDLMQEIRTAWHDTIVAAVANTAIPEKFVAALIANESNGKPTAKRFEPLVLVHLWEVALGRQAAYSRFMRHDLVNYLAGFTSTPVNAPATLPANVFQKLDELATSWGLTQIMGYHVLEWFDISGWYRTVDDLRVPEHELRCASLLLTQFANEFSLDLASDFSALFHCWNTGKPDGQTADASYTPNGIRRMDLYGSITS